MTFVPSRRTVVAMYVIVALLCTAAIGALWDFIWWHRYVGRDSFFILPHNVLYVSMLVGLILSIVMWTIERTHIWRRATIALILPPIAGPFDELWHTVIFREDPASIWAYWSPPHLLIEWSFLLMFLIVLFTIRHAKHFYGRYVIETVLWSLVIIDLLAQLRPVFPTGTIYQVLGFWGAGPMVFVLIFVLKAAQFFTKGSRTALYVAVSYLSILTIVGVIAFISLWVQDLDYEVVIRCLVGGYRVPPGWLHVIGWISMALVLDRYRDTQSPRPAMIAGLCYGGFVYGISFPFVGEAFRFSWQDGCIAMFSSVVAGYLAHIAFLRCKRTAFWQKMAIL